MAKTADKSLQIGALYEICSGASEHNDNNWLPLYLDADTTNFVRWLKLGEVFLVVEKVCHYAGTKGLLRDAYDICCILTSSGVGHICVGLTATGLFKYYGDVKKLT